MSRMAFYLMLALMAAVGSGARAQLDFDPPCIYGIPQEAKTVAVGDLNGDGRDDVAVTAWPSGLFVLYQQSDGLLGTPTQLYAPNLPSGLAIGDINGDSRADLAVGGVGGSIFLYYQGSDGSFGLPKTCAGYGRVNSLALADLNDDGLTDIADTSADFPVVLVSLQASDGAFGLPAVYGLNGYNARCIRTMDYNLDGKRDIAVLLDDQACYLSGVGAGGFEAPAYVPAQWAYALDAGDVTGDGCDDLVFTVATNQPDAAVGVIPMSGIGPAGPTQLYPEYDFPQSLVLADLNGDGRKDVVAAHGGYEAVTVLCQDGGAFGEWSKYAAPYCNGFEPGAIAVADLNSDGLQDVAVVDWWNGLSVLLRASDPTGPLPDTTAPVCAAQLSGTVGMNGWYVSAVTAAISAQDNEGGSGMNGIMISRDGAAWSPYSSPVVVSTQGNTSLAYYAEDNAGNRSQPQSVDIQIDSFPPRLSVVPLVTTIWPPNGATVLVPVTVTALDATSGVASLRLTVKDEYGPAQWESAVTPGATVDVPLVAFRRDSDRDGRVYTLILSGADAAGNAASAASTVTVPHSKPAKPKKER